MFLEKEGLPIAQLSTQVVSQTETAKFQFSTCQICMQLLEGRHRSCRCPALLHIVARQ